MFYIISETEDIHLQETETHGIKTRIFMDALESSDVHLNGLKNA